jgi:hypothetical protein
MLALVGNVHAQHAGALGGDVGHLLDAACRAVDRPALAQQPAHQLLADAGGGAGDQWHA